MRVWHKDPKKKRRGSCKSPQFKGVPRKIKKKDMWSLVRGGVLVEWELMSNISEK